MDWRLASEARGTVLPTTGVWIDHEALCLLSKVQWSISFRITRQWGAYRALQIAPHSLALIRLSGFNELRVLLPHPSWSHHLKHGYNGSTNLPHSLRTKIKRLTGVQGWDTHALHASGHSLKGQQRTESLNKQKFLYMSYGSQVSSALWTYELTPVFSFTMSWSWTV